MRFFLTVLLIGLITISRSHGQGSASTPPPTIVNTSETTAAVELIPPLLEATVELEIDASSFFTDMAINAVVKFPETVAEPLETPGPDSGISIISIDVMEAYNEEEIASFATISLLSIDAGLITIPSFEFQSDTTIYRTLARQILVSTPSESEAMTFTMTPAKTTVYAGEPLRIDVRWEANLITNQIRSMRCFPEVFSYPNSEILVPRNTDLEKYQMGMPFGGRRIIAKRVPPPSNEPNKQFEKFGAVSFPIYVKFNDPGIVELPEAKLEIAHLKGKGGAFAPYAAYFNNGLFEPLTSLEAFERFYVNAPAVTIKVLPLPEKGRSETFSGLFAPVSIETGLSDNEVEVGEVVEVAFRVTSDAPHGMLELPELGAQRALRGRFSPSNGYGRRWLEDGTIFTGRIRPLTTTVTALPSLQFQIFDPTVGAYQIFQTKAQPLNVKPANGKNFFDIRGLAPETTLTNQAEGVWHNDQPGIMSDLMNQTIGLLAENMLVLSLAAVGMYFVLLPWVKERRRRATNPAYRDQAAAYEAFKKLPERTEEKWEAFLHFLATSFSMPGGAWTPGEAQRLRERGISETDVQAVIDTHTALDATNFAFHKPASQVPELNRLGRRLFDHFRRTLPAIAAFLLLGSVAYADEWTEADRLFGQALAATPGEHTTESLFTQSALKFEAAAVHHKRSGAAWFNAGNAWFNAGEIGRAISCYRQARIYRPFDADVTNSLKAARALSIDVVEDKRKLRLEFIPVRWLSSGLVISAWFFITFLLIHQRFRTKASLTGVTFMLVVLALVSFFTAFAASRSESEGVVVAGSLYGRKGPAYGYRQAFNEPIHDGLEVRIIEEREEWLLVELADKRQCWVPADQVRRIKNALS